MLSKKKKVIILASMLVLLVVTGWLNIALNEPPSVNAGGDSVITGNFFVDSRTDRLALRNNTILILDQIINDPNSDEATIAEANKQKLALTYAMTKENDLEVLISSREGIEDCIVTMSGENINVIVKSPEFDDSLLSAVYNIIKSETGKTARYVNITPIE